MRIVVIGPGALGLVFAARLVMGGQEVVLLDYKPERARAINDQGVVIEEPGRGGQRVGLAASTDPGVLEECDLAMVCVKAYSTAAVAEVLGERLSPGAVALTLQNGLGNLERLAGALGARRVLGGITSEGATLLGTGRVRHAGRGTTHIAPMSEDLLPVAQRVVEVLKASGFEAAVGEDPQALIWSKLVVNVGINALTAILGVANGRLVEIPEAERVMEMAVTEAVEVARAEGVELGEGVVEKVRGVARATAANISSMLQDVRAGRSTEIEFINAAVCRRAEAKGLKSPVNEVLSLLVKALEAR